jgi:RNA polymerase sigma-70 factor, ECF subfamily
MRADSDDEAAFADVFDRHRDAVHAFLLGKTSDPEAARDLLQETFLRLWRRFGEVAALADARQRAWLLTVARNLVIDRYRASATRQATAGALAHEAERSGKRHPDPAESVEQRDQLAALQRAIAELPEDQRVILTMTAVGEMASHEVGEALGLPAGTVRYKLSQARARLARQLKG